MSVINTSASDGLRKLANLITLGCIAASMTHVGLFLAEMFKPGLFLYITILGLATALIGSQAILALLAQAIRGRMPWYVIMVGVLGVVFMEGVVSVPTSQVAINHNLLKGSKVQSDASEEAKQLRRAIERSDSRIASFDDTLASTRAENMTNRSTVLESIEAEERKISRYRKELSALDESSASKAMNQLMWGMSRQQLASVMAASLSVVPSVMSIMLGAMAFGRRESNVTPIKSKTAKGKVGAGKKLRAVTQALAT